MAISVKKSAAKKGAVKKVVKKKVAKVAKPAKKTTKVKKSPVKKTVKKKTTKKASPKKKVSTKKKVSKKPSKAVKSALATKAKKTAASKKKPAKKVKSSKSSIAKKASKLTAGKKANSRVIKKAKPSDTTLSHKKKTPVRTKTTNNITPITTLMLSEISPYQEKSGEEYMNENQREHFRGILQQRKQQILIEMDRTVHHLQDDAVNFADPNDRATQEEEFSLELRARDRELKFVKNIEEALQKLSEGEYGYCDACGIEIGIRRLEARPTANLCIDCKTLDEIREKQMGG
jgi:DnaK suppressor protein